MQACGMKFRYTIIILTWCHMVLYCNIKNFQTLTPSTQVRILVSQPNYFKGLVDLATPFFYGELMECARNCACGIF